MRCLRGGLGVWARAGAGISVYTAAVVGAAMAHPCGTRKMGVQFGAACYSSSWLTAVEHAL